MNKRLHAYYSGSVHGIGFRYTAERLADDLGLRGWAMNLRDGRVEVVVEGREDALDEFGRKIDDIFGSYIRDIDAARSEATGEFSGFEIRFD
jgi:acylphosphatase